MISNRQGGRRRGRGGQRGQNLGANRQDNRQRGNATQLHEKYKNMARDAQLAGDRVQSEYFLQFADHYFRVLGESRSRFEDQRRQRGEEPGEDAEGEEDMVEAGEDERAQPEERRPRGNGRDRTARSRAPDGEENEAQDERIAFDVLPPAIGQEPADEEEPAPKPRRKARRPRADDSDSDVAPAA